LESWSGLNSNFDDLTKQINEATDAVKQGKEGVLDATIALS
jgi:hypothetical protein